MKDQGKRRRYSLINIIMPSIIGGVFVALGIGVLIAVISSAVRSDVNPGAFIAVPIILFGLIPLAFGSVALGMSIRKVYFIIRENKANRSHTEGTARIIDYKTVSYNGRLNKRFALKLAYELNGVKKTFTTDYLYDINEFRYLKSKKEIAVKIDGNFVAVTEPFPEEIYTVEPKYEIEVEFLRRPAVKICMRVWQILCIIALVLFVGSIVLTVLLHDSLYIFIGAGFFAAVNFPFAVTVVALYIKWKNSTRG